MNVPPVSTTVSSAAQCVGRCVEEVSCYGLNVVDRGAACGSGFECQVYTSCSLFYGTRPGCRSYQVCSTQISLLDILTITYSLALYRIECGNVIGLVFMT
jgi:hypothetical protein